MPALKHLNEEELLVLIHDKNEDAIAEILHRNKSKLYTAIFMLVRDRYIAEDLFQDACIKVITKLREGKYLEDGKFNAWVMRVARNLALDHLRLAKRMVKITLPDGRDICELLGISDKNREQVIMDDQSCARARKMLDYLPYDQRETVVLRLYGGMSFKEIADVTGVSLNTSLGRMRYALINLRKVMKAKEIIL